MVLCTILGLLLAFSRAEQETPPNVASKKILFVGNSFTFVNDLPHQLKNVAASLGDEVVVANSTIGGCTLYAQTPEMDQRTEKLLQEEWDFIVLQVRQNLIKVSNCNATDVLISMQMQDYSALPTVKEARRDYLYPAVQVNPFCNKQERTSQNHFR